MITGEEITMNRHLVITILSCFIACAAIPAHASLKYKSNTLDPIDAPHFISFAIAQHAALPKSKKISIDDIAVSFDKEWLFKFKGKTSSKYRSNIINNYQQMLRQQIEAKLVNAGWQIVDKNSGEGLSVKAQLKDLYIEGPESLKREHVLVRTIGKSSIVIELIGVDNNPIFLIEDSRYTGSISGNLIETDRAMNYSWFNKLMGSWATNFVEYLDMSTPELGEAKSG